MFKQFLQHSCNIYSVVISTVGWEQTKTETMIYEGIPCMFYQKKKFSTPETWLAQETDTSSYSVIIEWDKQEADSWNSIELFDGRGKNLWKFLVQSVAFYQMLNGKEDHLNLSLSKI